MTAFYGINESTFLNSYIQCMLWSTTGTSPDGEDLESLEGFDLSPEAMQKAKEECESFLIASAALFADLPTWYGKGDGGIYVYAGHDFWLTRNRHGAGFWDRGLGDLGDRLTKLAQTYGKSDPYIGDDGLIYF
jgi:hypothetical protein|nr:MAG TPA: hypothetical protein [Caudoviricetes sp.]